MTDKQAVLAVYPDARSSPTDPKRGPTRWLISVGAGATKYRYSIGEGPDSLAAWAAARRHIEQTQRVDE